MRRSRRRPSCTPRVERLEDRTLLSYSSLVYPGGDGNLIYAPDGNGNRIEDFSAVGYQSGTVPLPGTSGGVNVPVMATLSPTSGDQTARIQAAIDQVSQLPLDPNGFRGAVLLQAGEYDISDHVQVNASGVVLLGQGTDPTSGTRLRATGTSQRTLIQVFGSGSRSTVSGTTHNLTDNYVPVGAISFHVDSTAGLHVGDTVIVHRPSTANWIHDIGMDQLQNPWQPNSKNLDFDRVITDIEGNQITLDAPLTNSLEQQYGGGTIYRYTWSGRLSNVGIANLYGFSDYANSTDENHSWTFITIDKIQNAWVNNVVSQYFAFACVEVLGGAKWVTVQNSQCLDPISQITGGRRYSFDINDGSQLNLFKGDYARQGRHDFTIQSLAPGPNVFVNCSSDQAYAESGPHQRWSAGVLFDNVVTHGSAASLSIRNAGNEGTGHGWQGANDVVWNATSNSMNISSPPTAQNWAIGDTAGSYSGNAIWISRGSQVQPGSLYAAQLGEKLAEPGFQQREYWLGSIDSFTGGENSPYVDPNWSSAVQQTIANGEPLVGFEHLSQGAFVPFTFLFNLAPGQQVVSATLSLGLRATGSAVTTDQIWLNDPNNPYSFSSLGWLPLPTTGTSARVFDLSGHLDLLQGGQLNVALGDHTAVDWAVLNFQVAPVATGQVVDLAPVADTYVRDGSYANQNFGTDSTLVVKNSTSSFNRVAFLRFDLSGVSGQVVQATLRLVPVGLGQVVETGLSRVPDNSWSETGITWNNQPASGNDFFTRTAVQPGQAVTFGMTLWVQAVLAHGQVLLSMKIDSPLNVGGSGDISYGSSRYGNAAYRPVLELIVASPTAAASSWGSLAQTESVREAAAGPVVALSPSELAATTVVVGPAAVDGAGQVPALPDPLPLPSPLPLTGPLAPDLVVSEDWTTDFLRSLS